MKEAIEEARKHTEELKKITAKSKVRKRPKPAKKETLVQKVARKLLELYYQPRKKFKPSHGKTVKGLRQAGISEKKIEQLRG